MDIEEWVTDLDVEDVVTLEIGECDPPHDVEAGFADFSVEDIDTLEVRVVDVAGWMDGELESGSYVLTVEFVDEGVAEEMDAIADGGKLRWQGDYNSFDLTLEVPAVESMGAMSSAHVEVSPGVPEEMQSYREAALGEASSLRADSLRRAIYADSVVSYCADDEGVDVGEFVEGLEAEDLGELIDEYGERMFPKEIGVIDVSERTRADVLSTLRYFYDL